jgi:hypothetical protein
MYYESAIKIVQLGIHNPWVFLWYPSSQLRQCGKSPNE